MTRFPLSFALRCSLAATLATVLGCAHAPRTAGTPSASTTGSASALAPGCAPVALPTSAHFLALPFDSGLPQQGQWRDGFDLADMDGDGAIDLLHGPPRKGRLQPIIFRGNGAGQFSLWREAHFPPLPYDYGDAKAADLNGDGRLDIALSSHLRGLATLINEADGHYAPWGEGLSLRAPDSRDGPTPFPSRSIALADWNGDGRIDLLALNEGPSRFAGMTASDALALYVNRDGYWERVRAPNALQGFGDALAIGDINGDGRPDALLGTQNVGTRLLLQIGDGATMASHELRSLPPRAAVTAVALNDFDRDGRDDMVHATRALDGDRYCSGLQVVTSPTTDDETAQALWSAVSLDPVVSLAHGDIDGDGRDDIVAVRQSGEILLFAGQRSGFTRDATIAPAAAMAGCDAFDAKLADLDGDDRPEMIVGYAGDAPTDGRCAHGGGFQTWHLRGR